MKKFFSILCALAIVLSASAAPVKNARAKKFQRATVEQFRAEKKAPAKKAAKKALAANEFAASVNAQRTLNVASKSEASYLRAPKAEAIDVECGSFNFKDWKTDGQIYLYSVDNTVAFCFDVIYGEGNADVELGKKYTLAEMDADYSGVFYDGSWHVLAAAEITKTIDEKGLVHFVGSCADDQGAAFTFHFDEVEFIPTGDTVQHVFLNKAKCSYDANNGDWIIKADDGEFAFKLDIFSDNEESPVGDFAGEDFDLDYTNVEVYESKDHSFQYAAKSAKASIFVENDTTIILAEILAEDGVVYSFAAFYVAPSKKGEATIEASNLALMSDFYPYFGAVLATASNADYEVYLTLYSETASGLGDFVVGDNAFGDITIVNQDSIVVDMFSGAFTVGVTNDGLALEGAVLCENDIEYTLKLNYVKPTKTREESISISDAKLTIYPDGPDWQVVGFNADSSRYVAIDIVGDKIAGQFTEDNMDANYTYIANVIKRNDSLLIAEQFNPISLDINVEFDAVDSVARITGTYLGQGYLDDTDVPEFTLDIIASVKQYVPSTGSEYDSDEDFKVDFDEYEVNDQYLAQYNVLVVQAVNAEGNIISLEFNCALGASDLAAGEYTINDSEEPNTVTAGSINQYIYGSFAGNLTEDGSISVPLWLLVNGLVTVNEDGSILVNATNTKGAAVQCLLKARAQGIENIELTETAKKVVVDGVLYIVRDNKLFNVQGTQVR
jgi:hypothetical protein